MRKNKGKRLIAVLMICILCMSSLTGFAYYNGFGNAYYEAETQIFDNVTYTEIVSGHPSNGLQHTHFVTADIETGKVMPIVFNGEVRSTYTLKNMIKYAEEQGYKVLAAINGDIYDTASGTPKGLVIHEGNIVTSGYAPDRVIGFGEDGSAALIKVDLTYGLKATVVKTYTEITTEPAIDAPVDVPAEETSGGNIEGTTESAESTTPDAVTAPGETVTETVKQVEEPWNGKIDFFNVPHGGANGLHLYNRHYASSTKTSGSCVEVVIECSDIQFKVNNSIKGIIKTVNPDTNNTPITDNTVVLSTVVGSATSQMLSSLKVGSEIEIYVQDNAESGLEDTKECLGIYYSLIENGKNVTASGNTNPRTAFGIKSNGDIVMLELDGRQASVSKGLTLYELANAMIDIGCETAVNLDGGGSSVIYVREPGKDAGAVRQSSPSEGSERSVANAILLVYKDEASSDIAKLNVYPALSFAMPGAQVQMETYASNKLYEKITINDKVSYSVDSTYGTIDENGLFTAGNNIGTAVINAALSSYNGSAMVQIVNDFDITPSASQITIEPGEVRDIDVSASIGDYGAAVKVNSTDELFTWSCDSNIGTIDEYGIFTATSSAVGHSGNIYVSYGEKQVSVPVQVGAKMIVFSDTEEHWAKEYIGMLAAMNVLNGMGDNLFEPDSSLTRAQFVAMLAKMTSGVDVSASANAGFADVSSEEWYYGYVNWGYENGIVNGMGDGTFAPNNSITREQMAVMLCNYARSTGFALPQIKTDIAFTDRQLISDWAIDYVLTTAGAGIINGFDTGDFQPQGVATRAQAATVVYKMCEIKGML